MNHAADAGGVVGLTRVGGGMSESDIKELFDRLRSVDDSVHSIDIRLTRIEELIVVASDIRKDQERRLRFLEKWAWGIPPALILGTLAFIERIL